ncbi:hypothetical protein COEREDRAFT_89385 [Coemansia reversa NRRL 1564]|uniref:DUF1764-domain-containing protein n=1 Tax=Coemansia reversa (strain ATCC 12441 / NRRL 1564) TaxID=763665 RepID=A0A2G5B3R6_COERN|nr:hypothetical protein COEREDRAFT_89385 [Coemansia reversa NRRL 1564]|eukprot:PIA13631.1 hypothetical protein COEREDRAFT_89385 [Coemansia reversa NRRL 1564]
MGNKVASGKIKKKIPVPLSKTKPTNVKCTKKVSEIDDIFATQPPSNNTTSTTTITQSNSPPVTFQVPKAIKVVNATTVGKTTKSQKQPPPEDDSFADSRGKKSKYTEDGLRVFYMDDLRIGEGEGDSELCPFDCQCCY